MNGWTGQSPLIDRLRGFDANLHPCSFRRYAANCRVQHKKQALFHASRI